MSEQQNDRLLLVLPILAYSHGGKIYVDRQACNGLRLWLENFSLVTCACPTQDLAPPADRLPIDDIKGIERLSFVRLPVAYTFVSFMGALPRALATLDESMSAARYLHFAIGGLWGDWGAVACLMAARRGRQFVVWTDRVESAVIRFSARSKPAIKAAYYRFYATLVHHYERYVIRRSPIGLFHGMDCYEAYAPFCSRPFLVHDLHLEEADQVSDDEIDRRLQRSGPLRIAYAGRVHREKGVFHWLETLSNAKRAGLEFSASWFGDGPDLTEARMQARQFGLDDCVEFPGSVSDHRALMEGLKTFDLFLFCHLTPESPRCLIEALVCGLPLIGYDSPCQRDLIRHHGGGLLAPQGDPVSLARVLCDFPARRKSLTSNARQDGRAFTATAVFRHRSELTRLAEGKSSPDGVALHA